MASEVPKLVGKVFFFSSSLEDISIDFRERGKEKAGWAGTDWG